MLVSGHTHRRPFARVAAASALCLCIASAATQGAADGLTPSSAKSAADVQSLIDAGNFSGAVSAAGHLVFVTGAAAADVDKAQVYALKGDAHLHLKQYPQASDAYAKAAKVATDPTLAATDTAMSLLIKRSPTGTYKPKQPGADGSKPSPVDIAAVDQRKAALGYLFADEFAAAGPKLKAAKTATTVPQLLQAADTATSLRQLEMAATGTDEKTKPEVAAVAEHAFGLLQSNLTTLTARVADIRRLANTSHQVLQQQRMANGSTMSVPVNVKAGLTSSNVSELRNIKDTCQRIVPAAQAFAKVSVDAGGTGGSAGWDGLSATATQTASEVDDVLNADYGNGVQRH